MIDDKEKGPKTARCRAARSGNVQHPVVYFCRFGAILGRFGCSGTRGAGVHTDCVLCSTSSSAVRVNCYGLSYSSLHRVSEVSHAISARIQSISEWIVSGSCRVRRVGRMDAVLCVQLAAQHESLERSGTEEVRGLFHSSPSRVRNAGRDHRNFADPHGWTFFNTKERSFSVIDLFRLPSRHGAS